jgi:tetratricopeptide (TPR) repeat protein
MAKTTFRQKILLLLLGSFLMVIIIETGLRLGGFIYLSVQERRNKVFLTSEGYRILCLGDSHTACGGEGAYPFQLQQILNEKKQDMVFSVINKGVPGIDSTGILLELKDNLKLYKPGMVIVMMGLNDKEGDYSYSRSNNFHRIIRFAKSLRCYKLLDLLKMHIQSRLKDKKSFSTKFTDSGRLYQEQGDYVNAERMFKKSIELNPADEENYIALAFCYQDQGKFQETESKLQEAIRSASHNEQAYVALGFYYLEHGDLSRSEDVFRKAASLYSFNDEINISLLACYEEQGKFTDAEMFFTKAIEINPRSCPLYLELGRLYLMEEKYSRAEVIFKKAIEVDPQDYMAYLELGSLYKQQSRMKEAKGVFKRAIEVAPGCDTAYLELISCREGEKSAAGKGDSEFRKPYFQKARSIARFYNKITRNNFNKLKNLVLSRGIRLICVQYPTKSLEGLKKMFGTTAGIAFVDNEMNFQEALKNGKYTDYFVDTSSGEGFGHCTAKGNRLLAENVADALIKSFLTRR